MNIFALKVVLPVSLALQQSAVGAGDEGDGTDGKALHHCRVLWRGWRVVNVVMCECATQIANERDSAREWTRESACEKEKEREKGAGRERESGKERWKREREEERERAGEKKGGGEREGDGESEREIEREREKAYTRSLNGSRHYAPLKWTFGARRLAERAPAGSCGDRDREVEDACANGGEDADADADEEAEAELEA